MNYYTINLMGCKVSEFEKWYKKQHPKYSPKLTNNYEAQEAWIAALKWVIQNNICCSDIVKELKELKNETEIWKPVPDWPTLEVSNQGRVTNMSWPKHRVLLCQVISKRGYYQVQPRINGRRFMLSVHQLVLMAFVGKRPAEKESRHLDGNALNNRLENLCWGTSKQNKADRTLHGTDNRGERCGTAKLTWKIVRAIRELWRRKCPVTNTRLAEFFGVKQPTIYDIKRGRTWQEY